MLKKRINDYTQKTELENADEILLQDSSGYKKTTVEDLQNKFGLEAGSYTPVTSDLVNVDSLTLRKAYYQKIGNIVNVKILYEIIILSADTSTQFKITLPIASNLSSIYDIVGNPLSNNINRVNSGYISAITASNLAIISFNSASFGTLGDITLDFSYEVKE